MVSYRSFSRGAAADRFLTRARELISFDAYVLGAGEREADGTIGIRDYRVRGLPESFVTDYPAVARDDVAAQLFSCLSTSVIAVCREEYPEPSTKKAGSSIRAYLKYHGVTALLLSGIDSSYGLAWLTIYRLEPATASFSPEDAEIASYIFRAGLYECQRASLAPTRSLDIDRYNLIGLSPKRLEVALRLARGYTQGEIASELGTTLNTIKTEVAHVRTIFPRARLLMDRLLGPLPPPRRDPKSGSDPTAPASPSASHKGAM